MNNASVSPKTGRRVKPIKKCCPCCHNYNVPVQENGFCADCGQYVAKITGQRDELLGIISRLTCLGPYPQTVATCADWNTKYPEEDRWCAVCQAKETAARILIAGAV